MSKIICDVCGTRYPDSAGQCPICGCSHNPAAQAQEAEPVGFEEETVEEIKNEMLTAAQSAVKAGKGYEYPVKGHFPILDRAITGDRKKRRTMAGY